MTIVRESLDKFLIDLKTNELAVCDLHGEYADLQADVAAINDKIEDLSRDIRTTTVAIHGILAQAVGTNNEDVIEMFDDIIEGYLGGYSDLDETITRMNALIDRLTDQAS